MRMTLAIVSLAASTAFAQVGQSRTGIQGSPPPVMQAQIAAPPKLSREDEDFVKKAGVANLAEIKFGELAAQKGATPEIRKLANTMVNDHKNVADQLDSIASREGITRPKELEPEQQAVYHRLSALSGAEFDKAYLEQVKNDHEQAISAYQDEAQKGANAELQSFAQSTLPSIRQHHEMISRPTETM